MATPRTTSSDADELAATISGLKSRLNELESATGVGVPPVGSIIDYIGATAPAGWAALDGTTITNGRFLHPVLWSVLPSTFKSGNNILLPDTRGRVTVHRSASGTLNVAIGSVGGDETVTLSSSQIPAHKHGMNHDHLVTSRSYNVSAGAGSTVLNINTSGNAGNSYTVGNPLDPSNFNVDKLDTDDTGGGGSHQNLQPYMIVVKIMKLA